MDGHGVATRPEEQIGRAEQAEGLPGQPATPLFEVGNTPFVAEPNDAAAAFVMFSGLARLLAARRPTLPAPARWAVAGIWLGMYRASYTLHNIGHVVSAQQVGAPMQLVRQRWGFQENVYPPGEVTPQQHIGRALGGPLASAAAATQAYFVWRLLRGVPVLGWTLRTWYAANALTALVSLAPVPSCDGGALLRWGTALATGDESLGDEAVQQVGFATAAALVLAALVLLLRRRWLYALGCVSLAGYMVTDLTTLRGRRPWAPR